MYLVALAWDIYLKFGQKRRNIVSVSAKIISIIIAIRLMRINNRPGEVISVQTNKKPTLIGGSKDLYQKPILVSEPRACTSIMEWISYQCLLGAQKNWSTNERRSQYCRSAGCHKRCGVTCLSMIWHVPDFSNWYSSGANKASKWNGALKWQITRPTIRFMTIGIEPKGRTCSWEQSLSALA